MTDNEEKVLSALYGEMGRKDVDVAWTTELPLVLVREILDVLLTADRVEYGDGYWRKAR